jgi:exodeoxyribonuclease VIII
MSLEVMLDLETMSSNSNASIVSIGAVKFDPRGKIGELGDSTDPEYKPFYCTVELTSCIDAGMHVSGSTIEWWLKQEKEAQLALSHEPRYSIEKALGEFWVWFGAATLPTWGNGADFDCVILHNAYEKLHGVAPFKFYHHRCYRTIKSLFPDVPYVKPTLAHHALSDAEAQAVHLQKLFNFINVKG